MKTLSTIFLMLTAVAGFAASQAGNDYPVAFPKNQERTYSERVLNSVGLGENKATVSDKSKVYCDMTRRSFVAKAGETVLPTLGFSTDWMHSYVYIDKNRNGQFDVSEPDGQGRLSEDNDLVSFSALKRADGNYYNSAGQQVHLSTLPPPAFTIPLSMEPGYYMVRYKVDWDSFDPAGRVDEAESIIKNGGAIVDVRLRIYDNEEVHISTVTNGGVVRIFDGRLADGVTWTIGKELPLIVTPDLGNRLKRLTVRHGNLSADSIVNHVAQYTDETIDISTVQDGLVTLEGALLDGDMLITAEFEIDPEGGVTQAYKLIFNDEFNQPDGSQPDPKKWRTSTRYGSTWNRWISDRPEVAFIRDGALVCRAIPNPDTSTDNVPMITGAKETRDKFLFTYGKVEVRLKTTNHRGNFPAAWMMPQPPCDGWPKAGEIDIFESIDTENKAYHTVHTHWTWTLGNKNNPQSSFSEWMDVENWHVFGLIWEKDLLIWTVDGREVGRYAKSSDKNALNNGQWPFTAPFYLILNQSVGNGSWAANADTEFTYETLFDYIRVYQKKKIASGIENFEADDVAQSFNDGRIYDLLGRKMSENDTLQKGIYISNGRKFVVK